ncbi:hypothetical protein [Flavobacterium sp.]|uniref:hypothetical protein n=1 Tax=Flavobacterium sp. TaxID=239 RepID=UPI0025BC8949|nr:hypothetical protein [Flavobacterium sp.]MBA4155548.1 hypothetical protein [Flavobacterium sp.]
MNKLLILLLFFLLSCAPKEAFQQEFPVVISNYYYSNNGNKIIFIVQFEKAIPAEIQLQSLYFRNQKTVVEKISDQNFQAVFVKPDLIFDSNPEKEYGNEPPTIQKSQFNLKPTEAVLEFKQAGIVKHYKFRDVVERATN